MRRRVALVVLIPKPDQHVMKCIYVIAYMQRHCICQGVFSIHQMHKIQGNRSKMIPLDLSEVTHIQAGATYLNIKGNCNTVCPTMIKSPGINSLPPFSKCVMARGQSPSYHKTQLHSSSGSVYADGIVWYILLSVERSTMDDRYS
jgi:hypothetical protein